MRPRLQAGLLAAVSLVVGVLAVATPPTLAAASGQVCEGVVIDDANGSAAAEQTAQVAPGTSDLQALSTAGDTVTQNDTGLVCAIDDYPANGLQNCTTTSGGLYDYWSYWQGDPYTNTWTYAEVGPSEHTVSDGQTYVQGWRYQDPGPSNASAPKPSVTPAAAFAQACPGVTPVAPSGSGGGTSSGGGGSGSGRSAPPTTAAVQTTTATTVATAPGVTPSPEPGGAHVSGGTTTTTGAAGGAGPPGAGDSTSTTTTTTTTGGKASSKAKAATPKQAASVASQSHAGGDPALPIVLVAVLIALLGAAAWFRWRRRPGEE